MSKKRIAVICAIVVAGIISIACSAGSKDDAAPRNADTVPSGSATVAAAAVKAVPVTVTGKGESVKTIELVAHGYTVAYEAKSFCLIVTPVDSSGADTFSAIVNQCASKIGDTVSGTATYAAKGPVTVHVQNTDAAWTLTFTPLG